MLSKFTRFTIVCLVLAISSITAYIGYKHLNLETYYIGVSLPLSGDHGADGRELLNSIQLMSEQLNFTNVLAKSKKKIEFIIRDDKNDPATALEIAKEFALNPKLLAVIGPYYFSKLLGGAKDIYAHNKIVVITPYESNPDPKNNDPYCFSMQYSVVSGAKQIAIYLKEIMKKENILVIYNNDALGLGSKNAFEAKAKKIGLSIAKNIEYNGSINANEFFLQDKISAADKEKIDAVVIFSHKESGINLIKELRKLKITVPVMGTHTFSSRKYLNELDENESKDVMLISPFLYEIANEQANKFREEFEIKYGEIPGTSAPLAADAIVLLNDALKKTSDNLKPNISGSEIRAHIQQNFKSLTWQNACSGLTGNLYFDADNAAEKDIFVSQIVDGRFKVAYTQLFEPKEEYILKQLQERIEKGYVKMFDNVPYHIVDVVFAGVDFVKINEVDPKSMLFETELFLWFKWQNPNIDVSQIDFINLVNRKEHVILKENLQRTTKYRAYKTKASFFIPFDLTQFPFDHQELPVYLAHKNKNSMHLMFAMDTKHMDYTPITSITPPEWNFKELQNSSMLYRFNSTFGDPDYRIGKNYKSKIYFSTIKANIIVKRKLLPYMFNLFLPLAVIVIISFLILRIPVDQFVLRTNTTSAAIMSILLYYLAQKATLPKVGYMMKADYYFILLFIYILCLQSFNIIINQKLLATDKARAEIYNKKFSRIFIGITIIAYAALSMFV